MSGPGLIPAGLSRLFQTVLVGPSAVECVSFHAAAHGENCMTRQKVQAPWA